MAWTRTMSERALEREFLEADAVRMIWELNYRLLMESGLTGQVLQVEQVTAACQTGEQSTVQSKCWSKERDAGRNKEQSKERDAGRNKEQSKERDKGRSIGQSKQLNKEQKKGGIRLWQLLNNLRDWIWGS